MTDKDKKEQSLHEKLGAKSNENEDVERDEELEEEISEAEQQLTEAQDKLIRAHAEMENIRRRAERDVANAHKYALEKFVSSLLPVVDSLEQALQHSFDNDAAKAIHEGIELTMKMFLDTLQKIGVEQINPVNDNFNPQFHEAMSMIDHPDAEPNTVVEVFQKGYLLNGRLVRPARVIVVRES